MGSSNATKLLVWRSSKSKSQDVQNAQLLQPLELAIAVVVSSMIHDIPFPVMDTTMSAKEISASFVRIVDPRVLNRISVRYGLDWRILDDLLTDSNNFCAHKEAMLEQYISNGIESVFDDPVVKTLDNTKVVDSNCVLPVTIPYSDSIIKDGQPRVGLDINSIAECLLVCLIASIHKGNGGKISVFGNYDDDSVVFRYIDSVVNWKYRFLFPGKDIKQYLSGAKETCNFIGGLDPKDEKYNFNLGVAVLLKGGFCNTNLAHWFLIHNGCNTIDKNILSAIESELRIEKTLLNCAKEDNILVVRSIVRSLLTIDESDCGKDRLSPLLALKAKCYGITDPIMIHRLVHGLVNKTDIETDPEMYGIENYNGDCDNTIANPWSDVMEYWTDLARYLFVSVLKCESVVGVATNTPRIPEIETILQNLSEIHFRLASLIEELDNHIFIINGGGDIYHPPADMDLRNLQLNNNNEFKIKRQNMDSYKKLFYSYNKTTKEDNDKVLLEKIKYYYNILERTDEDSWDQLADGKQNLKILLQVPDHTEKEITAKIRSVLQDHDDTFINVEDIDYQYLKRLFANDADHNIRTRLTTFVDWLRTITIEEKEYVIECIENSMKLAQCKQIIQIIERLLYNMIDTDYLQYYEWIDDMISRNDDIFIGGAQLSLFDIDQVWDLYKILSSAKADDVFFDKLQECLDKLGEMVEIVLELDSNLKATDICPDILEICNTCSLEARNASRRGEVAVTPAVKIALCAYTAIKCYNGSMLDARVLDVTEDPISYLGNILSCEEVYGGANGKVLMEQDILQNNNSDLTIIINTVFVKELVEGGGGKPYDHFLDPIPVIQKVWLNWDIAKSLPGLMASDRYNKMTLNDIRMLKLEELRTKTVLYYSAVNSIRRSSFIDYIFQKLRVYHHKLVFVAVSEKDRLAILRDKTDTAAHNNPTNTGIYKKLLKEIVDSETVSDLICNIQKLVVLRDGNTEEVYMSFMPFTFVINNPMFPELCTVYQRNVFTEIRNGLRHTALAAGPGLTNADRDWAKSLRPIGKFSLDTFVKTDNKPTLLPIVDPTSIVIPGTDTVLPNENKLEELLYEITRIAEEVSLLNMMEENATEIMENVLNKSKDCISVMKIKNNKVIDLLRENLMKEMTWSDIDNVENKFLANRVLDIIKEDLTYTMGIVNATGTTPPRLECKEDIQKNKDPKTIVAYLTAPPDTTDGPDIVSNTMKSCCGTCYEQNTLTQWHIREARSRKRTDPQYLETQIKQPNVLDLGVLKMEGTERLFEKGIVLPKYMKIQEAHEKILTRINDPARFLAELCNSDVDRGLMLNMILTKYITNNVEIEKFRGFIQSCSTELVCREVDKIKNDLYRSGVVSDTGSLSTLDLALCMATQDPSCLRNTF